VVKRKTAKEMSRLQAIFPGRTRPGGNWIQGPNLVFETFSDMKVDLNTLAIIAKD